MAKGISSNLFSKNFFNHAFEKSLTNFRKVQQYKKDHLLAKKIDAIKALKLSKNTIAKYWEPDSEPRPDKQNFASVETRAAISKVADEDKDILNIILHVYLEGEKTFDCDLTFGRGDFYKGLPYLPNHCYDKYPVQSSDPNAPKVYELDEIDKKDSKGYIPDNSLSSIVIDLPQEINKYGKGTVGAFKSMTNLAETYNDMLRLAQCKLRYATPTNPGGLLIVKVGDIIHKGETIWLSQIVSELIVGPYTDLSEKFRSKIKDPHYVDLDLVDKFVHRYKPEEIDSSIDANRSIKAHDYYLVFRKGHNPKSQVFYYVSERDDLQNSLDGTIMDCESYGPKLEYKINKVRQILKKIPNASIYEVVINDRTKKNTLYLSHSSFLFKETANRKLEELRKTHPQLPYVFPRVVFTSGHALLKYIKDEIVEKYIPAGYVNKVNLRHQETSRFLSDCGIKYICFDNLNETHPEPIWVILKADTLQITKVNK